MLRAGVSVRGDFHTGVSWGLDHLSWNHTNKYCMYVLFKINTVQLTKDIHVSVYQFGAGLKIPSTWFIIHLQNYYWFKISALHWSISEFTCLHWGITEGLDWFTLMYQWVSMFTHPFSNYGYFFLQVFDEKWNTKNDDENLFFEIYNTNK